MTDAGTNEEANTEEATEDESLTGVVEPEDEPEPPDPREEAEALGLMVPGDWTDDQVREAVAAFQAASDDAEAAPPSTKRPWKPASPRG